MKNLMLVLQILNDPTVKGLLEEIINFIKELGDNGIQNEKEVQQKKEKI